MLGFDYDALNRMTRKTVPERSGLDPIHSRDVFYAYDLRGLQPKARFDSLSDEGVTNAYDGFGRMLWTNTNQGGQSRTLWFEHDADGHRTRLTHPAGGAVFGYLYDGVGRMIAAHEKASPASLDDYLVRYWYKPSGDRRTAVRGGGSWGFDTSHYYDAAMRKTLVGYGLRRGSRHICDRTPIGHLGETPGEPLIPDRAVHAAWPIRRGIGMILGPTPSGEGLPPGASARALKFFPKHPTAPSDHCS
ncbi:MAG TPA: hypothetical protein VEA60_13220 [Allosphingosinicella sp.]|nr:hypothetical protein [Allosphingosinicella sp.]